ncbi:MAG: type II secretion system F family protein [Bacillota bacterium]|nr:type II secretion system F family protein [Bacillota bacterium]
MELIISAGLFVFFLVTAIFYKYGKKKDTIKRRLKMISVTNRSSYEEELNKSFFERFFVNYFKSVSNILSKKVLPTLIKVIPKTDSKKSFNDNSNKLETSLKSAGIAMSASSFSTIRVIIAISVISISLIVSNIIIVDSLIKLMIVFLGLIVAVLIPRYYLKSKIKKRQSLILHQLPDLMEILSVSIEAGLGFDAALLRAAEYLSGPLIDEILVLHREIQMGKPKRKALSDLAERNDVPALKGFSTAVIQSDQLGIPIKTVLRAQSEQLRAQRKQIAEEKGAKTPVLILIPMLLFVFPVIFIVLLGPTIIQIVQEFVK